jgi:hypothetical protein
VNIFIYAIHNKILTCFPVEGDDRCPTGFFRCHDGECIHEAKHCDGHTDCKDNFDEFDCGKMLAEISYFQRGSAICMTAASLNLVNRI